jgi:hypothetical protein
LRQVLIRPHNIKQRVLLFNYIVKEGCRYVWQSAKNCVKPLLGREPWGDVGLVFIRHYIPYAMGLMPIRAISCAVNEPYDGAGAQAFLVMNTLAFARANRIDYLHAPFSAIGHADPPMPEWVAAWEAVFNLGAGEVPYDASMRGVLTVGSHLVHLNLAFGGPEPRKSLENCFKALIPEFRRKYYLNKTPRLTANVTVAVHIRRGDVSVSEHSSMFTDTEIILRIASAVKSTLASHEVPFSMRIYGQGSIADFHELSSLGAEFFLDADPFWTLQELVEADILVVAKSCFSNCAGLISDGIKIFEEPWSESPYFLLDGCATLEGWLPCQPDGFFDRAAFERQLFKLLQGKRKRN